MDAYNKLIQDQIPFLRRYARALLREGSLADDLVQDTLERAWNRLHLWQHGSNLRAWLFTIMHNVFVNQRRRIKGYRTVELDDQIVDNRAHAAVEQPLELRDLQNALQQLSVEFREVVLLISLEQLTYEETATVLSIPVGTVMSRLARGREKLRVLLSGESVPQLRRIK